MKIAKVIAILFLTLSSAIYAKLIRTVTGYGNTQAEAYSNAVSKIPAGYRQVRAQYFNVASNWQCYIRCEK
jgi:hypothetical protein